MRVCMRSKRERDRAMQPRRTICTKSIVLQCFVCQFCHFVPTLWNIQHNVYRQTKCNWIKCQIVIMTNIICNLVFTLHFSWMKMRRMVWFALNQKRTEFFYFFSYSCRTLLKMKVTFFQSNSFSNEVEIFHARKKIDDKSYTFWRLSWLSCNYRVEITRFLLFKRVALLL